MADPYPDWLKKGSWSITANHPGAGYQVKFTVPFFTGMHESPKDYRDIRFSDASDNALYYWIESYTDTEAVVWVKLESSDTTGTLHYGYSEAVDASDGPNTFEFFDNAESGSVDDKWAGVLGTGSVSYSTGAYVSGSHSIYVAGAGYYAVSANEYDNFILECNLKFATIIDSAALCFRGSTTELTYYAVRNSAGTAMIFSAVNGTNAVKASHETTNVGTNWQKYTVVVNGSTVQLYLDNVYTTQWTAASSLTTGRIGIRSATINNDCNVYVDDLRVRKYISTEPTPVITEASASTPATDFSADVSSGTAPLTVTFTDSTINTPTSWAWKFGDGETSEVQNPVHIYAAPGTYKVILTATNEGGSDTETKIDYIEVTPSASTVFVYLKETEMDHKIGSTQKHGFKISAWNGSGFKSTCTAPVISCSVNGFDETTETWAISAFSATMNRFTLEVVDPGTWVAGDNIHIQIVCDEGFGDLFLNIVPNYASLATYTNVSDSEASIIAAIDIDAALTLYGVATSAEIGGIGTGGNEHVITGYSLNASTKTITITEVGYTTLSIEQIKFIYNITQGCEIYDRETPRKRMGGTAGIDITINGADITFIEDATMTNNDKLLIVVNV